MNTNSRHAFAALLSGLLFGIGLVLGGMTDPRYVLGFLDVFGQWDPRLVFVMGGAVVTTAIGYRLVWRRRAPLLSSGFARPRREEVSLRLIAGAMLFGAGWGLAGYCPGPALESIGAGAPELLGFVAAMVCGWWLVGSLAAWLASPQCTSEGGTHEAS